MEVHHHAGEHHGPKKFKDYFLEFLMIFLAVSMGFLAENFREYITDKHHVEELAGQLKEDLMNDTTNAQKLIEFEMLQVKRADSLYVMLMQPASDIDYKKLQDMIISCDRMDIFYPSMGAISTIKKELHLKEFVKTKIALHIDNYEKVITFLNTFENRDIEYLGKYIEAFVSNHFTPGNSALAVLRQPVANGTMRNISADVLTQLAVDISLIKAYDLQLLNRYMKVKEEATAFIRHVSTTYQLED
jgi:hypothetical protein